MTIWTTCLMALAQQMCILDPFLQNPLTISSLGQSGTMFPDNLSLWWYWLCNSHSASKNCHLSVDGFYFLISTNRTFFNADHVFFPQNDSLSKTVYYSSSLQIPAHSIPKNFIQQETGKPGELQQGHRQHSVLL